MQLSITACSAESQKMEERLLPGWMFILVTRDGSVVIGNVDQTSVEQRGLQTEAQLGEELGKSKHGEKCVFASRFIRDKIMYVFFFYIQG